MATEEQTKLGIIEQLNYHQANDQSYFDDDFDDKLEDTLVEEVLHFANQNPEAIKKYVRSNIILNYVSSNYYVYRAMTYKEGSTWYPFLFEEIKRVVKLVNTHTVTIDALDCLNGIFTFDIYYDDHDLYNQMLEHVTACLDLKRSEKYNLGFLSLISFLAVAPDFSEFKGFERSEKWIKRVLHLANNGPLKTKLMARSVLEKIYYEQGIKKLSFMEKISSRFIS
ncbi:hypothetical protein [Flammeovirga aprica]|uniref:Uncharacterized protein n=1 Tax=Flammeovirga aprica JL-4 TaxID=694437 RepID=A0A7X9P265_9BACT|nr:hypothetical protein [Flammeovirga aprica]NME67798.1 hypothetical protein [Flammeovirga aprica JL-4]